MTQPETLLTRIRSAKARLESEQQEVKKQPLAWQFLSELVAGILVGGGIGYGLDTVFASKPWCFVAFLLLGIAGAFWNMMRLAQKDEIRHKGRES